MVMGAIAVTTVIIRTEAIAVTTAILRTEAIAVIRYAPYGSYRSWSRPWGYGNGYGGVGRRWPPPYVDGYQRSGYEEQPRPPAPILYEGDY